MESSFASALICCATLEKSLSSESQHTPLQKKRILLSTACTSHLSTILEVAMCFSHLWKTRLASEADHKVLFVSK